MIGNDSGIIFRQTVGHGEVLKKKSQQARHLFGIRQVRARERPNPLQGFVAL